MKDEYLVIFRPKAKYRSGLHSHVIAICADSAKDAKSFAVIHADLGESKEYYCSPAVYPLDFGKVYHA